MLSAVVPLFSVENCLDWTTTLLDPIIRILRTTEISRRAVLGGDTSAHDDLRTIP